MEDFCRPAPLMAIDGHLGPAAHLRNTPTPPTLPGPSGIPWFPLKSESWSQQILGGLSSPRGGGGEEIFPSSLFKDAALTLTTSLRQVKGLCPQGVSRGGGGAAQICPPFVFWTCVASSLPVSARNLSKLPFSFGRRVWGPVRD